MISRSLKTYHDITLSHLLMFFKVALIANNMDPNPTAPWSKGETVHTNKFWFKFSSLCATVILSTGSRGGGVGGDLGGDFHI